jgi:hypothetical protein
MVCFLYSSYSDRPVWFIHCNQEFHPSKLPSTGIGVWYGNNMTCTELLVGLDGLSGKSRFLVWLNR